MGLPKDAFFREAHRHTRLFSKILPILRRTFRIRVLARGFSFLSLCEIPGGFLLHKHLFLAILPAYS